MKKKLIISGIGAVFVFTCVFLNTSLAISPQELDKIEKASPAKAPASPKQPRKLLVFTHTKGYKHSSIPYCTKALEVMGRKTGAFEVVVSDDMSVFSSDKLNRFDAVCLNNTTKLDFSDPALRRSLLDFVKSGKGIIGIHAATDNFYNWPEAADMLGGLFDGHPWRASGTWAVKIDEPEHPLTAAFEGRDFKIKDEIYRVKGASRRKLRVLLSLDLTDRTNLQVKDLRPSDKDIPISWIRKYGKGRVFYCSLGHNHEIYWNPAVLAHYLAGIQFALGDLEADATPSVESYLEAISKYEFGGKRRPLALMDEYIRSVLNKPEELKVLEHSFLRLLESDATTPAAKQYICRQLGIIGTEESVEVLSRMLTATSAGPIQPADMARYALERIPSPSAVAALRQALGKTTGSVKVGIINSLGVRRDAESVGALKKLLYDTDQQVAVAAVTALGRIADNEAAKALAEAVYKTTGPVRKVALDAYLNCADELLAQGRKAKALKIYKELYKKDMPTPVRIAALKGTVKSVRSNKAVQIISEAIRSEDAALQGSAIALARQIPGRAVTNAMVKVFDELSAPARVQLITALADRRDKAGLRAVLRACKDPDVDVRIAGYKALGVLGDVSELEMLIDAAAKTTGAEQRAAREGLYLLGGTKVDREILQRIPGAQGQVKVELIRSIGRRGISAGVKQLLKCAKDDDQKVRIESLRVLRELAGPNYLPELISLLTKARSEAEGNEAETTVAAVARKIEQQDLRCRAIVKALASKPAPPARARLVNVLGRIGADCALEPLRKSLADDAEQVRLAAIRALADWKDARPAEDLLKTVRSTDHPVHRALALRGYIRLIGLSKADAQKKVEMYSQAMELSSNADEKKMVLSGLSNIKDISALQMASELLSDESLREEAAVAVIRIARAIRESNPEKARQALQKVLQVSQVESVRRQAKELLEQGK